MPSVDRATAVVEEGVRRREDEALSGEEAGRARAGVRVGRPAGPVCHLAQPQYQVGYEAVRTSGDTVMPLNNSVCPLSSCSLPSLTRRYSSSAQEMTD